MPTWLQWLLWASAAVLALGTLWTKLARPLWRFSRKAEEMVPLLVELTEQFRGTPQAFAVLDEIVAQFRTNSGSSLRDAVNRLDNAAIANAATVGAVQIILTDVLQRIVLSEASAKAVADRLATAQDAVDGVAADLAGARHQADMKAAEPNNQAGEVADVGAQTPPSPDDR